MLLYEHFLNDYISIYNSDTLANNDEAFIGLVGFSPSSFALQVTNRNSVSDLNGSGECVGAAWKLTGAVSFVS